MSTSWTDILPLALRTYNRNALPEQCQLLNITENATYLVPPFGEETEPIVLRLNRPGYRSDEEVVSEQLWIKALRQADAALIPAIIPDILGHQICWINDQIVIASKFIDAHDPKREDWVECFGQLGGITARMHIQARSWRIPTDFVRPTWNVEALIGAQSCYGTWASNSLVSVPQAQVLVAAETKLRAELLNYGQTPENFGLIHSDLRISNILVTADGQIHVIDFDDCGFGWYLFDLACALSFIETQPEVPAMISAWLQNYQCIQPLTPGDISIIPAMIMMRRLQMTAWMEARKETDFAAELRAQDFVAGTLSIAQAYLAGQLFTKALESHKLFREVA
jgi:Ser/Thr protein kinase RdoA (MazF antagonist)